MQELFSKGKVLNLEEMVEYSSGGVISKQVLKNPSGNITLFSFDKGQGLTEHTAPLANRRLHSLSEPVDINCREFGMQVHLCN
jgi:quercetin dioxygenase-like cupin family protein